MNPTPPELDPALVRRVADGADLSGLFAERAVASGMTLQRAAAAELAAVVVQRLRGWGAGRVVAGVDRLPQGAAVAGAIAQAGIELLDWRAAADVCFDADAGVTGVHGAVAETGSLVCCSDAEHARSLSLTPPRHLAIVRAEDIMADLVDLFAGSGPQPPSSLTLITGPSKTADIEGQLVTGVHGPGEVHVVLVERA